MPAKRPKVPDIGHHSLRHAFATAVYHEKRDIVSLSKLLGHANPSITWNIYVHGVDEKTREAAESFKLEIGKKQTRWMRFWRTLTNNAADKLMVRLIYEVKCSNEVQGEPFHLQFNLSWIIRTWHHLHDYRLALLYLHC